MKGKFRKSNGDYWENTYRVLNPFMPPVRCRECGEKPTHERTWYPEEYCNAVSVTEFKCASGHCWEIRRTFD